MGTRADFYIGVGPAAEWLGSVALDGYGVDEVTEKTAKNTPHSGRLWAVKSSGTDADYRTAVAALLAGDNYATTPDQGWPWPWETSRLTDYAYAFDGGACKTFRWGGGVEWPDMAGVKATTLGPRSGFIVGVSS